MKRIFLVLFLLGIESGCQPRDQIRARGPLPIREAHADAKTGEFYEVHLEPGAKFEDDKTGRWYEVDESGSHPIATPAGLSRID